MHLSHVGFSLPYSQSCLTVPRSVSCRFSSFASRGPLASQSLLDPPWTFVGGPRNGRRRCRRKCRRRCRRLRRYFAEGWFHSSFCSLPGLEVPDAFAPCFRPMVSAGGPRAQLTSQKRMTGDAQAGLQRKVLGEREVQREVCTRTSSTRDMTFSEKVSEHGFLREVAQTGTPQEVARGAVMEQTGGTEEGVGIQMSSTFLDKSQKKISPKFRHSFVCRPGNLSYTPRSFVWHACGHLAIPAMEYNPRTCSFCGGTHMRISGLGASRTARKNKRMHKAGLCKPNVLP